MNAIFGVDPSVAVLSRRTRDRFALGVGGSYGQKDYWLGQLDPASRKSHSAAPTPSHEFLNPQN
ncbi:hypothetical protein [Nostoc sp. UIC 10630]|uniref:hypothetical protein n=1 Tax=Nostoc sp. UIC 10630 TaxID=2100146 RepID=UPI0013D191C0|nr:hypothetical protein [Nostoc sp. UIC 10630]NEU82089.1 hypothetical protein [Nostoc sp. UIC 10630]